MTSNGSIRPYGVPPPGFRLPDATAPGTVHLQVSDLARSLEYYERVIGFRAERVDGNTAALLVPGNDRPMVVVQTRPGVKPARRGAFGLFHFAILVPDRSALGRFAVHVSSLNIGVGMADHLVSEALYLSDPDRLGIEVYADRPPASWRFRDRELVMATDPLDITALMRAGGDRRWDGLPDGTTLGHVHLHVGDLEKAEDFYHRGLGLEKTVWSYPGALFLAAGGYHHHLGTNVWSPGPAARPEDARLMAWELIVPSKEDVSGAAASLRQGGYAPDDSDGDLRVADPWGTELRVRARA